jgi:hypothetical protein
MQPVGVVTLPVCRSRGEASGLPNAFRKIFCQVSDVASGFFRAAEDALDVHLRPEPHDVRRLGQLLAGLFPGG